MEELFSRPTPEELNRSYAEALCRAQEHAIEHQCIKWEITSESADGAAVSQTQPVRFELAAKSDELHRYNCPSGIVTLLEFYKRAAMVFLIVFILSLVGMVQNYQHNVSRNMSRSGMYVAGLPGTYVGLPVRKGLESIGSWMMFSHGTCWEIAVSLDDPTNDRLLVHTPDAVGCSSGPWALLARWLELLSFLIIVGLLEWLKWSDMRCAEKTQRDQAKQNVPTRRL